MMEKSLWPCALQYAVYLHNIKPTVEYGVSPLDVLPRTKRNLYDLLHTHGWGCPTSIVPNWESRSSRGQYVGYHSPLLHASSVGVNLNTQNVSLQFHVMYDDFFESKTSNESNPPSVKIWERLYEQSQVDWNSELPDLAEEWLSPGMKQSRIDQMRGSSMEPVVYLESPLQREEETGQEVVASSPPSEVQVSGQAPSVQPVVEAQVEAMVAPSPPTKDQVPVEPSIGSAVATSIQLTPAVRQSAGIRGVAPQGMTYVVSQPTSYFQSESFGTVLQGLVACVIQREHFQHELLREYATAFKAGSKMNSDLPNFIEAMIGEHGEDCGAVCIEMQALQKAVTWEVGPGSQVPSTTNVPPLTWVQKLKQYDKQNEGIDFDKYAPDMVRMLIILTVQEKLKPRLVDFPNAFAKAKLRETVDAMIARLKKFDLTVEETKVDDANVLAYLQGVEVQVMTFLQKGLVDKVLKATGLDAKPTSAGTTLLGSDADGPRCQLSWDNASVIEMLYAVHQCARSTNNPGASHGQAILQICGYLKGTQGKGLVCKPNPTTLDCYVDADFVELWRVEDPVNQTEIVPSTVTEYRALLAMRDLLPTKALLDEIHDKMQLSDCKKSVILSKVWKDDSGVIKLADDSTKPQYHWKKLVVKLMGWNLAEEFTKPQHQLEKLVGRLMEVNLDEEQLQLPMHSSDRTSGRMRGSVAAQGLSASCVACGDCTRLVHEYKLGLTMAVTCTGLCQQWYVPGYGSSSMTIGMVHDITYSSRSKAVGMVHDVTYGSFSKAIGPVQDIGYGSFSKAVGPVQARLCRCGTQATHSKSISTAAMNQNTHSNIVLA